jgi:hypothetical protein
MPICQKKIEKLEQHIDREEQECEEFSLERLLEIERAIRLKDVETLKRLAPHLLEDKSG